MLNINIKFFWGIVLVLLFTLGWASVELVNAWNENTILSELPTAQLHYPKPIQDTDMMHMAHAGYLMGASRKEISHWKEDSTLLYNKVFKPIKLNKNETERTN